MKAVLPYLFCLLFALSCSSTRTNTPVDPHSSAMTFEPNEDGEYDIVVMDTQFDVYLRTIAQPKWYYSYDYYRTKNRIFVTIWNQRHAMPMSYNPNLYAVSIDLDPRIDYGLDFEYKLYNFFKFIEWKYRVRIR